MGAATAVASWALLGGAALGAAGLAQPRARNASVVLHVGPHKTGTTYLQATLQRSIPSLLRAGYCFDTRESLKYHYHDLAVALLLGHPPPAKLQHVRGCLSVGRRVIVSSETFSAFKTREALQNIRKYFANQSVHVVAFYRDPLSLLYSAYTEVTKKDDRALTFSDFVMHNYQEYSHLQRFDFLRLYVQLFGRRGVTLVDYNGVLAARGDVAMVFLCDVVGILCQLRPKAVALNSRPSMLRYNLFRILRAHALGEGCAFRSSLTGVDYQALIAQLQDAALRAPVVTSDAEVLRDLSLRIDREIRDQFADIMLFNNPISAQAAIGAFSFQEIDERALLANHTWGEWMRAETSSLRRRGWLVGCM